MISRPSGIRIASATSGTKGPPPGGTDTDATWVTRAPLDALTTQKSLRTETEPAGMAPDGYARVYAQAKLPLVSLVMVAPLGDGVVGEGVLGYAPPPPTEYEAPAAEPAEHVPQLSE